LFQRLYALTSVLLTLSSIGIIACSGANNDTPEDSDTDTDTAPLVTLENGQHTFSHQGLNRKFRLYQPNGNNENAPLVFVMHGYGGSAIDIMDYTGMNDLADTHGFVVAYPQGTQDSSGWNFFNVGYEFHLDLPVDDVAYIRELAEYLQTSLNLDPNSLFATGMSNGGDISYLLACEASDMFTAIAPVAGTMQEITYKACDPENPLPVFEIHGTDDDVTYYEGDLKNVGGWGAYMGIPTIINFWVEENGLEQQESTDLENINTWDGSNVVLDRYWSDDHSREVWLYRVEGGGHDWPGVWGNMDINASEAVWDFFSQYVP
jgi:polyhydroxybutyrate depolymerase